MEKPDLKHKYHSVMLCKSITIKSMAPDHRVSKWYILYFINTGENREKEEYIKYMKIAKEIGINIVSC